MGTLELCTYAEKAVKDVIGLYGFEELVNDVIAILSDALPTTIYESDRDYIISTIRVISDLLKDNPEF